MPRKACLTALKGLAKKLRNGQPSTFKLATAAVVTACQSSVNLMADVDSSDVLTGVCR